MRAAAPAPTPDLPVEPGLMKAIDERLAKCSFAGRAFSLLVVRGPIEPLTDTAEVIEVDGTTVVTLPGIHLDRACALAERWVRHHPDVRIGVASAHPQLSRAKDLVERARVALRTAESVPVGKVVSMSWADVSTDIPNTFNPR